MNPTNLINIIISIIHIIILLYSLIYYNNNLLYHTFLSPMLIMIWNGGMANRHLYLNVYYEFYLFLPSTTKWNGICAVELDNSYYKRFFWSLEQKKKYYIYLILINLDHIMQVYINIKSAILIKYFCLYNDIPVSVLYNYSN